MEPNKKLRNRCMNIQNFGMWQGMELLMNDGIFYKCC